MKQALLKKLNDRYLNLSVKYDEAAERFENTEDREDEETCMYLSSKMQMLGEVIKLVETMEEETTNVV